MGQNVNKKYFNSLSIKNIIMYLINSRRSIKM